MAFGVFIHRSDSIYDDTPAERYQFPSQYLGRVESCIGDWIIYYEPRRTSGDLSITQMPPGPVQYTRPMLSTFKPSGMPGSVPWFISAKMLRPTTLPAALSLIAWKEEVLALELVPAAVAPDRSEPSAFERQIASRFKIADHGRPGDRWLIDTVRAAWRTVSSRARARRAALSLRSSSPRNCCARMASR